MNAFREFWPFCRRCLQGGFANCPEAAVESPPAGAVPLSQAPVGCPLRLARICGGGRLAHRLAEMGLAPGTVVTVLQRGGGPVLVAVRDSRIALGQGMARQIQVTPAGADSEEARPTP